MVISIVLNRDNYLPMVVGYIKFAVCLSVCLFGMHLLQNCWADLAEIFNRDRGLSLTLHLTFWWPLALPQGYS